MSKPQTDKSWLRIGNERIRLPVTAKVAFAAAIGGPPSMMTVPTTGIPSMRSISQSWIRHLAVRHAAAQPFALTLWRA